MKKLIISLTDVIVKVTVADFIATLFWQMLLPLLCEMVLLPTIYFMYYDVTHMADVIANDFVVVDVKTTFWTSLYNG